MFHEKGLGGHVQVTNLALSIVIFMVKQLIKLLIAMKLKPTSGWGRTIIIWKDGEISLLTKEDNIHPDTIN